VSGEPTSPLSAAAAGPLASTADPSSAAPWTSAPSTAAPSTADILAAIDRLESLLRVAPVCELEVEVLGLGITLRKPDPGWRAPGAAWPGASGSFPASAAAGSDSAASVAGAASPTDPAATGRPGRGSAVGSQNAIGRTGPGAVAPGSTALPAESALHAVLAPLTGTWYITPSPGAAPYVRPGDQVTSGQVVGLIEAMKLFNEIKADASGRVVHILAEHGSLVKAKQPLIEIELAP
jgi:acetyl-CoA carboxylase biotin carboxyl carrier protein